MLSDMDTIGQRIKYVRKNASMTQAEFASSLWDETEITRGAVGNWELDKGISRENLVAIGDKFGVSLDWLNGGLGSTPSPEHIKRAAARIPREDRTAHEHVENPRAWETISKIRRGPDAEGFGATALANLPIRGEVAAGRWLETPALLEPAEITDFVEALAIQPALAAWIYGLTVRGTSINKLAVDGDVLVCLDVMSGIEFSNRDLVIVERVRDQGALREVTAKRLIRRDGRFILKPESTDPMWQNEIEIGDDVPQDDAETRFIAKVKHIIKPVF